MARDDRDAGGLRPLPAASSSGPNPAQASIEMLRRDRAYDSLVGYAEYIRIPGAPISETDEEGIYEEVGTGIAPHHRLFMRKIQECMETPFGRLMIFSAPGTAKSTYATVVGATWYIGKYPGKKIILASYGSELAEKHGKRAKSIIKQDEYFNVFGTRLKDDTRAAAMWALENGSEYMSGGILSGMTGNRADGLICDDPVKNREAADSPVVRATTKSAYDDDLDSRLLNGAWEIIIQTRWHPEDLAGSILPEDYAGESGPVLCRDGQVWEIVNLPAECEFADDPLGRPIGDGNGGVPGSMIWGEYYEPRHWDMKRAKKRTWAALYQQRPRIDEDSVFNAEWLKWYKPGEEPKRMRMFLASDYAVTEDTKADFTEHGVAGVDEHGDLWLCDWSFGQWELDKGVEEKLRLADKWRIRRGYGEVGVIRRAYEPFLRRMQKERRGKQGCTHSPHLSIEYLPHIGDKPAKFQAFKSMASSGKVHILESPWGRRLEQQLSVFPDSRYKDDGVDVCSLFGRAVDQMTWARPETIEEKKTGLKFGSWDWLTWDSSKPDGGKGTEKDGPRLW